jgi:WD40 repeat protein
VWDAETGEPVARANDTGQITVLDGVPVLVDTRPVVKAVTAIDLRTGAVVRRHDVEEEIIHGAVAVLDGRPVIATSGEGNTIVIRDLDTGSHLGAPLVGHEATPNWLGVADLKGRPVLVSAAQDNTIRVWDLAVRAAGW